MRKELNKLIKIARKNKKSIEEIEDNLLLIKHIKDCIKKAKSNKYFYIGFSDEDERFYYTNSSTSIKVEPVCKYYKDFQKMILNIFNEVIKEKEYNILKKIKNLYNTNIKEI